MKRPINIQEDDGKEMKFTKTMDNVALEWKI